MKTEDANGVGEVIIGDITYIRLASGRFCYLALFQDKFTRRIVGWKLAKEMTADLVVDALRKALRQNLVRRNAIVHTDRGSQYVSNKFRKLLRDCRLQQSMSGKGNCCDNAQSESFFSRLKSELIEDGIFDEFETARSEIFGYVEFYYNRKRRHSGIDYRTPLEFENELKIQEQGANRVRKTSAVI